MGEVFLGRESSVVCIFECGWSKTKCGVGSNYPGAASHGWQGCFMMKALTEPTVRSLRSNPCFWYLEVLCKARNPYMRYVACGKKNRAYNNRVSATPYVRFLVRCGMRYAMRRNEPYMSRSMQHVNVNSHGKSWKWRHWSGVFHECWQQQQFSDDAKQQGFNGKHGKLYQVGSPASLSVWCLVSRA